MAKKRKMDETELAALVGSEIRASIAYDESELSDKRADAIEYLQGIMRDVPARPGRSSVTSRDLADVIGWILPGVMRVFTASDQMVVFEPERPGDEQGAQQATDFCNYVFWKDNDGYRVLYNGTYDSLLHGDAIGKIWWDDSETCEYSEHSRLTEEQISLLTSEEGVEVLASTENEEPDYIEQMDPQTGQMIGIPIPTYDIKIKRETKRGRIRVMCIPPEDFLIDSEATTLAEARFLAHCERKTRSELIEMGFRREEIEALPADGHLDLSEEHLARNEDRVVGLRGTPDPSQELVELYECYIKADVDGDGEAEVVRVYYAGKGGAGQILDWDVWESEHPFFSIPCSPVPHKWNSGSISDETMDIQRIKTVLIRQALDNFYASNLPIPVIEEGSIKNMDALLNPKFGNPIITKVGKAPPQWQEIPNVAGESLQAVEFFDGVIERRTGVSRTMMALDPEALQNQTATANQNAKDASYSQVELISRNQAELGWREMFRKMLRLLTKHQDRPRTIRLRDKWVEIDPRHWNANMDCTVNVGLGTGSRDRDMAMLNVVLANQAALTERMAGVSPQHAVKMLPLVLNTMRKIAESAGLKSIEQYFPEVSDEDIQQFSQQMEGKGDPAAQAEAQKVQAEMQMKAQELQMKAQGMQQEAALKREQMMMEMQLKREQLQAEMALKREQLQAELSLKAELGVLSAQTKVATTPVHMGGDPG